MSRGGSVVLVFLLFVPERGGPLGVVSGGSGRGGYKVIGVENQCHFITMSASFVTYVQFL